MARRTPKAFLSAAISLGLSACALVRPLPEPTDLSDRLAMLPTRDLPLERPVRIYWNAHQVPFIEAETDSDLAFTLGLVHAHLRLGQMELLKRISQGRLAEIAGPVAIDIDHSLRILDFGKSAPATRAMLPDATRQWLERFVQGVNHLQRTTEPLPHEFAVLGLGREPWTIEDVLTIGRLAGTDINWLLFFSFLPKRADPGWPDLWARLVAAGSASITSFESDDNPELARLGEMLGGFSKSGSNSAVVAPSRSARGSALMANDPHLGITLPNLWLTAGYSSPSYHAVGLMIPGLPFTAIGRNPEIAWGGTNMRAASSDLVDVSALSESAFSARTETIKVRWWPTRDVTVRDSPYGPLITDIPLLNADTGERLALRWAGHRPSDEISAMLAVNRATSFEEFRRALEGFAVSGQNMLYADRAGHIGQVLAVHLPRRPNGPSDDVVRQPADAAAWDDPVTAANLPFALDPERGFIASANNRATENPVPISYFYAADDRIQTLNRRLAATDQVTKDDLTALQRDVFVPSSLALRDLILERLEEARPASASEPAQAAVVERLRAFDGHYSPESEGAVAFELTLYHLARTFLPDATRSAYASSGRFAALLAEDLREADPGAVDRALEAALASAAEDLTRYPTWGDMHRLSIAHILGRVPVIGGRYRIADLPVGGSTTSLMKTAHGLTDQRHSTRYGSQARHISDLGDPDANWFVLLGGQDGWLNSSTFKDQVELWRSGRYVKVPLTLDAVRAEFAYVQELTPRAAP